MDGQIIRFGKLVSAEPKMIDVFNLAQDIAQTDATVLILGESGTGKELMAQAIHERSKRAGKPFVAVNCSAIPDNLIESVLFGHVRGAFTDAVSNLEGKFKEASGGTLFLDEIGDMSPTMQAKILRALENREIQPVGSSKTVKVDIRLLAATNKDLEKAIAAKEFRNDLFYRINEITVTLLPLRRRQCDLHLILWDMIQEYNKEYNKNIESVSLSVLGLLQKHDWPGNVRELRNIIKRTMLLISDFTTQVFAEHLPVQFAPDVARNGATVPAAGMQSAPAPVADSFSMSVFAGDRMMSLEEIEKNYISLVLEKNSFNKSKAARILGIDRTTLYEKIKKYQIEDAK